MATPEAAIETTTTFTTHSDLAETPTESSTTQGSTSNDPLEAAKWTRYLPESFGIRDAVRQSSYRWCVREG